LALQFGVVFLRHTHCPNILIFKVSVREEIVNAFDGGAQGNRVKKFVTND
jgi:hypothetical protein